MTIYVVKQGDCLSSIARDHGFSDWRPIYDHPQNADFKAKRPDPNLIFPGDRLFIPERESKTVGGGTGQRHQFLARRQKTFLNLKIEDEPGTPMQGDYILLVEGVEFRGTLDGEGRLSQRIPPEARQGELWVVVPGLPETEALRWELMIGSLDPLDILSGVQGRLWNLGIDCGPVDNIIGPLTKAGVRTFQKIAFAESREWDGIPGKKTQGKLREHHEV